MNYKLAIFDMDGTILHTLDDIQDSINHIFRNHNLPERTYEEVRSFVGSGLRKLVERAVPEGTSAEDTEVLVSEFCAYYADHCAIKTAPYKGIIDAINKLRAAGVKTAVSTNKPQAAMEELVELHFKGLFDVALGESPERARKPAPDSVYATLDILGLEKADAVYIGDSDVDVATAKNSGVDCIAVTWGFRSEELLKSLAPEYIIHKPEEIVDVIVGK